MKGANIGAKDPSLNMKLPSIETYESVSVLDDYPQLRDSSVHISSHNEFMEASWRIF